MTQQDQLLAALEVDRGTALDALPGYADLLEAMAGKIRAEATGLADECQVLAMRMRRHAGAKAEDARRRIAEGAR